MSYEFSSIASGPATSIVGCYHPDWCLRDDYPAGTDVLCLRSPDDWRRIFEPGEIVTLSDCWAGTALRLMLNDQQRITGGRFATVEALL